MIGFGYAVIRSQVLSFRNSPVTFDETQLFVGPEDEVAILKVSFQLSPRSLLILESDSQLAPP